MLIGLEAAGLAQFVILFKCKSAKTSTGCLAALHRWASQTRVG